MLFGKHRVSNRMHQTAATLVRVGTTASAFWILSLNSWMQTPAGFIMRDGIIYVESWWAVICNPSFPYRLTHMLLACLLTVAFLLMGISSWRFLNKVDGPATFKVFKTGLAMALVLAPLQIFVGDLHGINTLEHQPAKIAAIEIPKLASLILTHDPDGEVIGLNEFEGQHPPVAPVFWAFPVMVGVGMLMLLLPWWFGWRVFVQKLQLSHVQLRLAALMTYSGWVAVLAGWYVTEIGRQPWIVYEVLRVQQTVARHGSGMVLSTLILWLLLYAFILFYYIATMKYLVRKPSVSLLANAQNYPGPVPGKEF